MCFKVNQISLVSNISEFFSFFSHFFFAFERQYINLWFRISNQFIELEVKELLRNWITQYYFLPLEIKSNILRHLTTDVFQKLYAITSVTFLTIWSFWLKTKRKQFLRNFQVNWLVGTLHNIKFTYLPIQYRIFCWLWKLTFYSTLTIQVIA